MLENICNILNKWEKSNFFFRYYFNSCLCSFFCCCCCFQAVKRWFNQFQTWSSCHSRLVQLQPIQEHFILVSTTRIQKRFQYIR